MANATARVPNFTSFWDTPKKRMPLSEDAATYYPGEMLGRNEAGYVVKFDDSGKLKFVGLMAESHNKVVAAGGNDGDEQVDVSQPMLFTATLSSVSLAHIGRRVFAKYSNEVQLAPGTNCNFAGWVVAKEAANTALIAPPWSPFGLLSGYTGVASAAADDDTVLTQSDVGKLILVPNESAVEITLPSAALCSPGDRIRITKTTADAYAVTISPVGSEKINAATSFVLPDKRWATVELITNGSNWFASVSKQAALTAQLTTITHTAPGTPDYAVQNLTNSSGYGFATADEGNSVLAVIANLQVRMAAIEQALIANNIVASA